MTLYDAGHFFHPNHLGCYSLGTKNKSLALGSDGSLTLYAGHRSPGADRESNWLPSPAGSFSLYLRAYGGQAAIADATWIPPLVIKRPPASSGTDEPQH
ncbi:DUF1214 domain-containing protein [Streptomyces sp. NPDC102467]|uniref:DUF1214 domain-containing protein n=1 Tax=Streptomyces sp. NPDC102467 TaxID=3366179 RepID=UPI0037FF4E75